MDYFYTNLLYFILSVVTNSTSLLPNVHAICISRNKNVTVFSQCWGNKCAAIIMQINANFGLTPVLYIMCWVIVPASRNAPCLKSISSLFEFSSLPFVSVMFYGWGILSSLWQLCKRSSWKWPTERNMKYSIKKTGVTMVEGFILWLQLSLWLENYYNIT